MNEAKVVLNERQIKAIEEILRRGQMAEVIPVKNGIKIRRVYREEFKTE